MSDELQALRCSITMTIFRDSACSLPILITLFYTIVAHFITILHAEIGRPWNPMCNPVNHTKGSKFESNVNTVFSGLVQRTPQTGFNTSEYGQSPDQIYGLLQCRADTTFEQCYNCSQEATSHIRQGCGNAVGGSTWRANCFLRYENYSFIGKLDTGGWHTYREGNISNSDVFAAAVEKLLYNLSAEATSGTAIKRSAFGTAVDTLFRRIYALVQCTRDISTEHCSTCLSTTINSILVVYPGNIGVQGLMKSCIVRYEIYSFFNSTALSPLPAEAPVNTVANTSPKQITPSNNNITQINHSDKKSSSKIPIISGAVGGLLLVLFVCMLATWRRLKAALFRTGYEGIAHYDMSS